MRRYFLYLLMILLATGLLASCNDDFDTPPMVVPTAKDKPNTTIADFKAKYWKDAVNYIDTVKDDIVIHGYVTSSDETGNIYKSLYIQDETGGLTISVNQNSLFNTYRVGQEIVIPMKGAWIGKYNGQQQLGYPQYYQQGSVWEATFLPQDTWEGMAQLNGLPNMAKVDTMTVKISDLKTDKASLLKYQGRLVKLQNVKFEAANGELTYAEAGATTNRNLVDNQGNTIVMRNSNYATFRNDILPLGSGDVVGLLYYYNTHNGSAGTWQLYIRSTSDVIGFSTSTKGLLKDPYSIAEAISLQNQGKSGWVSGYVVGAVAPEVTSVKSNSDIEWKAPTTLDNTLVIADDPNCTDASKCVAVSLPQGTPFRAQANLKDNEAVYKTKIWVKGTLATYMNMAGITGNSGSTEEFRLSVVTGGVTSLNEGFDGGKLPTGWTVATVSGDKNWYVTLFDNNYYAAMTGYKGTNPPFESWLITPALDIKNATSKVLSFLSQVNGYGSTTSRFQVYVLNSTDPATATVKQELNAKLAVAPASGYSAFVESGDVDLSKWADGSYYIGFRHQGCQLCHLVCRQREIWPGWHQAAAQRHQRRPEHDERRPAHGQLWQLYQRGRLGGYQCQPAAGRRCRCQPCVHLHRHCNGVEHRVCHGCQPQRQDHGSGQAGVASAEGRLCHPEIHLRLCLHREQGLVDARRHQAERRRCEIVYRD